MAGVAERDLPRTCGAKPGGDGRRGELAGICASRECVEVWREIEVSNAPARVGDTRARARSTELENAGCSWSDEDMCPGNWKSGGSGEFCSRLGRDGGLCVVLCERFREAGFLLEVAADLASASGPSSLLIAG